MAAAVTSPWSKRCVRAAEAGAVADGEHLGPAGAALGVGQRLHRPAAAQHETMGAAQRPGQLDDEAKP